MDLNLVNTVLGIAASVVVIVTALVIVWRAVRVAERKRPILVTFVAGLLAGGVVAAAIVLIATNALGNTARPPSPKTKTTALPQVAVLSTEENGVEFQAPITGTYTIRVVNGAYQPLPPGSQGYEGWTTLLDVYVDKPVQFGPRYRSGGACEGTGQLNCTLTSPVGFNAEIGSNGFESDPVSAAQAAQGHTFVVQLQKGDVLTFVALDEKGGYGDNVGTVDVALEVVSQ